MKPESKQQLLSKIDVISKHLSSARKDLERNNMEGYYANVKIAATHLDGLDNWNSRNKEALKKYHHPDEEMDNKREDEGVKRNIENRDRLGYEY